MFDTFSIGDEVIWVNPDNEYRINRFGSGPLSVANVIDDEEGLVLTIFDKFGERSRFRASILRKV